MYALAGARLNVPSGNILHVGDELEANVTGVIRYGMQAAGLTIAAVISPPPIHIYYRIWKFRGWHP